MACWHRRYNLGDVQPTDDPETWIRATIGDDPGAIALPLYLLDHGGISISTSDFRDPWDSGRVGWIVASSQAIRAWFGVEVIAPEVVERARVALKAEVSAYDHFLQGDVWGYQIVEVETCETCEHTSHKVTDSCWGFYGSDALAQIREHIPDGLHGALAAAWDAR